MGEMRLQILLGIKFKGKLSWCLKEKWTLLCLSSVQLLSHVQLFVTPWTAACQASLSITTPQSLLKLMFTELVMACNHLILCHPHLLLPSVFPRSGFFSNESALCIRWSKYWSFSFSISPSNKYSGLISFTIDWFDLLAVQGTLESLLQHHSSSINSLALSLLYGPTLTSIHDDWKNHSFDYMDQFPHIFSCLQFADPQISKSPSFVLSVLFKFILFSPNGFKAFKPSFFFGTFLSMKPSYAT